MRFLSDEWVAAVRAALADVVLPGEPTVTVAHVVRGAPGGDRTWVLRITAGRVSAELRPGEDPAGADIVFVEDYDTAAALATGALRAEEAVAAGRLKLRTGAPVLVAHAGSLAGLADALASLRSTTVP